MFRNDITNIPTIVFGRMCDCLKRGGRISSINHDILNGIGLYINLALNIAHYSVIQLSKQLRYLCLTKNEFCCSSQERWPDAKVRF